MKKNQGALDSLRCEARCARVEGTAEHAGWAAYALYSAKAEESQAQAAALLKQSEALAPRSLLAYEDYLNCRAQRD